MVDSLREVKNDSSARIRVEEPPPYFWMSFQSKEHSKQRGSWLGSNYVTKDNERNYDPD